MLELGGTVTMTVETPVAAEVDVLVAGGGTAGCLAALAAARNGACVMLVERHGYLGGMVTAGNAGLTMFMKFSGDPEEHAADQETLRERPLDVQIAGGITKEFADRLISSGAGIGNFGQAGSYIFTSSEDTKRLLFDMMEEAGVQLRLHSWAADVLMEGDTVRGVVVESKSGRQVILAKMAIDATGDGDLCVRSGVPFHLGVTPDDITVKDGAKIGEMHAMGVMFKAGNVDLKTTFGWLTENPNRFAKQPFARFTFAEAKAHFERGDMATINILMDETPRRFQVYNLPTPGVVTLCCPSFSGDGTNVEDLTRAEVVLAGMVDRWLANMRANVPGFEGAFLLDCPEIGVRETRHIAGEHVLNIEDIYKQVDFPDSIGRGSHPIDTRPRPAWLQDPETSYPPRWFFHIPFRSLIAKERPNLMVVGRCMSATHEAFGCIRPTVQCMITGEAAGTAAALSVGKGLDDIRALPFEDLRNALTDQGVLL
ncbi:MAG: FAD-dependent oxidoreductase [Lentisphaerae bacterium]|jgi:hypothetical protein|nr:FAD-dependent oxidoreductase [Lentisphaerota bacterium]MBT4817163.1 FAD-dependent oxidoreductase [Lentisphaerota bacterium]MBT5612195.1 FAD-dependent oxidoreductase [Lentisphaerota bacterium]MBT7061122.1 FAD-dependent oxidoreductase [Lentisphaerota bacterium]MBT7843451.1 FAD-dependent oxidoreductase [Lentisphaerota bacterium]